MAISTRIPPNVIAQLPEEVFGTLAALAGERTTIGPGTGDPAVTAADICRRRTLLANAQPALHTAFVKMGLYRKHRDVHNHPTDYSMRGKMIDGTMVFPITAKTLRDQIKRMDDAGTKAAVLMAIPLKQSNVTQLRPIRYQVRRDRQRHPSVKADGKGSAPASPRSERRFGTFLKPLSIRRPSDAGSTVSRPDSLAIEEIVDPDRVLDMDAHDPTSDGSDDSGGSPPGSSTSNKSRSAASDINCGNVDHKDATYYLKPENLLAGEDPRQPTELYYYSMIDAAIAMSYQGLTPGEKERFYPMITGFNVSDDQAWQHMHLCLSNYPQTFVGGGEFTVHKEIVDEKVAGTPTTLNLKGLDDLLRYAGQVGIFMTVHCDIEPLPEHALLKAKLNYTDADHAMVREGETARDGSGMQAYYTSLLEAFRLHPHTPIVWAHGAGLGRFVGPRDNHLQLLEAVLRDPTLNHVCIDLSWDQVAAHINANPETLTAWANMLNTYPDRFMFGSDSLVPLDAAAYGKTYRDYQGLRALLADGVEEMVFSKNLKALVERSKTNRDSWERAGCPPLNPEVNGLNRPQPEGSATKKAWQSLKRKVGDGKDAALTRLANRGKQPSLDGAGNTTKVNVREVLDYKKMSLEEIFDDLQKAFVDKFGEGALQQHKNALLAPIVFPAAEERSNESDSSESQLEVRRVPTWSVAPPSAVASAEDLTRPLPAPSALDPPWPVAAPSDLDRPLPVAAPSDLDLTLTMPGSSRTETPRFNMPGSSWARTRLLPALGLSRNSAHLNELDRSIRETQAQIEALRARWAALDVSSDAASDLNLYFSK